jgi:predicted RNase H-like HicB family nuclease
MTYPVVLIETEEGFAVGCPALPGCWSQGATREEALANIREAIREVLDVKLELEAERWQKEGLRVEMTNVEVMALA